jgi:PAS domain S-box-containing protein
VSAQGKPGSGDIGDSGATGPAPWPRQQGTDELDASHPQGIPHTVQAGPLLDGGAAAAGALLLTDLTEKRETEASMRDRAQIFAAIFSQSIMAVIICRADGTIAEVNEAACELVGVRRDDAVGTHLLVSAWSHVQHVEELEGLLATARSGDPARAQVALQAPDGSQLWLDVVANPVNDAGDDVRLVVLCATDVTEEVMAREELRSSELRFRDLVDLMPQLVYVFDPRGHTLQINGRAVEFFGGDRVPWVASDWTEVCHPDDLPWLVSRWMQAFTDGEGCDIELRLLRQDAVWVWTLNRLVPVRGEDGSVLRWFGTTTDISEQKAAQEVSAESARARSAFLATMSHEIRTPMNAVLGLAELLAGSDLSPEDAELVAVMRHSGQQMVRLVNDILDFSRLESGQVQLHEESIELRGLVAHAVRTAEVAARQQGLQLTHQVSADVPMEVHADAVRLQQVLGNLLSNAVKFSEPGGTVGLDVACRHDGAGALKLVIDVHDTGVGIAPEHLESIFDPFVMAHDTRLRSGTGSGLGLAISAQIVERMGGSLRCTSTLGQGSCFTVALPVRLRPEDGSAPARSAARALPAVDPDLRVLVVEDNPVNQRVIALMLDRLGVTAEVVSDGAAAVEAVRRRPFDLVLMDLNLPVMDGLEATRRILAGTGGASPPAIVAVTANALQADREASLAAGMDEHLAKPVSLLALATALARYEPRGR